MQKNMRYPSFFPEARSHPFPGTSSIPKKTHVKKMIIKDFPTPYQQLQLLHLII